MKDRIYANYFMKNRYKEYEEFLKAFLNAGYQFICIRDYEKLKDQKCKHIILRHDIDSDVKIAKKMFEIEKQLNIKSTYYFRLCTFDVKFINEIYEYGSEVGYHYEEIAQYCKDKRDFSKDFVDNNMEEIKKCMINNITNFEEKAGMKIDSIASHGDFINRKINVRNEYLYDTDMKKRLNLIEAYDVESMINFRTIDAMYPKCWQHNYKEAINSNSQKVLILVHPRWWNKAPITRTKLEIQRIVEAIKYK